MKNKFWNWTKNEETGERILRLDGVIDDFKWGVDDNLTTPKEFREELQASEGDIVIYINSPGGNTDSAAEIYAMLKEYSGGKITVKIPAFAASAATIIAMAADTVEISPIAFMMIHNPYLDFAWGEEKDLIHAAQYLADLKENIINVYEIKTGLSREKIAELMDAETYMNAKKAVELHFADKIMFEENQQGEGMTAEMYSERQALNSLVNRFKKLNPKSEKKVTDNRVDAMNLQKRLRLITH